MAGRRGVAAALRARDAHAERAARAAVDAAKTALGERGPPWWDDGAPDSIAGWRTTRPMPNGLPHSPARLTERPLRPSSIHTGA